MVDALRTMLRRAWRASGDVRPAAPHGRRTLHAAKVVLIGLICNGVVAFAPGKGGAGAQTGSVRPVKIVAFGDSLTAGYMLAPSDAFPVKLEAALTARGHRVEVVNAGVSGDTTGAGRDRLAWSMPDDADAVILELGANDALRGLDPAIARANLEAIMAELKKRRLDVLIAGMRAPRNLGPAYMEAFDRIYPELAARHGAILHPFFLERVALKPQLNLGDGIHPNAQGVAEIVADILPRVEELIARVKARKGG